MDDLDLGALFEESAGHLDRPVEGLAALTELRSTLVRVERLLILEARRRASTWDEIGGSLGISRQAAHRRHAAAVNDTGRARPRPSR